MKYFRYRIKKFIRNGVKVLTNTMTLDIWEILKRDNYVINQSHNYKQACDYEYDHFKHPYCQKLIKSGSSWFVDANKNPDNEDYIAFYRWSFHSTIKWIKLCESLKGVNYKVKAFIPQSTNDTWARVIE